MPVVVAPLSADDVAAAPDAGTAAAAAAGVLSAVVEAVAVPVAAGWLCANAGTAIAADNASSAQIILLMANANARCFIFPLLARQ
ncbi:hypothetical protein [Paraburkholderia sp. GAS333]|uniref:hypothetical protein n=1 Tax=Paraburkholderia sp. GAS333 TaxID=3156279 RepID=UPI003D261E8B